jgi:hypothetical protein
MPSRPSTAALAALLLCAAGFAVADTYKWIDAQGQIHYSDRPPPAGAEKVEVLPAQTYHAPAVAQAKPAASSPSSRGAAVSYSVFEIRRPQTDDVIPNSGGSVSVELRVDPILQAGHSVWLYLDGKRLDGLSTTATSYELSNVIRGEHTLVAAIVDAAGKQVIAAPAVKFGVRQTSVAKPPVGPALQPPPPH